MEAFVADIDMTLTNKGDPLPQIVKDALEILHSNNIRTGLATGREIVDSLKHMGTETWGLSFDFDFVIGMNGGMIYDLATDDLWAMDFMPHEDMVEILDYMMPLIDQYKISVNAEGGMNHNAMNIQGELLASAKRHGFTFVDKTGDPEGFCEYPAYKYLFRTSPEYEDQIRERFLARFADRYQIISTFPGTVEIMQKGIHKGNGMKKYADAHGLHMENIISFGDNENDNALLTMTGWGVALKNAAEKTKEAADDITEFDVDDGGVGHYLFSHYIEPNNLR